jgi:pimeloyl-ACP methyl ester carboxylesterase
MSTRHAHEQHVVQVEDGYRLWTETIGARHRPPLLLVMGANASGLGWPDGLVERLAEEHFVVRYDHRDTGRSTRAYDEHPYPIRDLAPDALAVLDGVGLDCAHAVGMSVGGILLQLVLLDAPERLASATLFGTAALGGAVHSTIREEDLPGPDPRLMELWADVGHERDEAAELAARLELWRLLHGEALPFDTDEYAELEHRVAEHSGTWLSPTAHVFADQSGLDRGVELADVSVPTLVLEGPADPLCPPPHARRLADVIPSAHLETVPGLGHSIPAALHGPLAAAITRHTHGG